MPRRERALNALALFIWGYAIWLLLTWTVTAEQLVTGALTSALMAAALVPLIDRVARPWSLLRPARALAILRLIVIASSRIVTANARLTARIWRPSRPLSSGMVVVTTAARTDAELAAIGLISSLIVDNQLVDLDRHRHQLQYHVLDRPEPARDRTAVVTGGTEELVRAVVHR